MESAERWWLFMSDRHRKFSIAVLFIIPLLVLINLTLPHFTTLQKGNDVILRTEPIQDKDANENYIVLNYEVEKVPKEKMTGRLVTALKKESEIGQTKVYGVLKRENGVDELVSLTEQEPSEGVYLTGWLPQTTDREYRQNEYYMVDFNLDRFYVPKKGHVIADSGSTGETMAHFKVLGGQSILRDVQTN